MDKKPCDKKALPTTCFAVAWWPYRGILPEWLSMESISFDKRVAIKKFLLSYHDAIDSGRMASKKLTWRQYKRRFGARVVRFRMTEEAMKSHEES